MKRLVSALLAGVMLTVGSASVYAADETTVSISAASYNSSTKKVEVTGNVQNMNASQILTVMSTGVAEGDVDVNQIIYIDQNEEVSFSEDGSFSLKFSLSDKAQEGMRYFVKIGGSNISNPACMAFEFKSNGGVTIIYGDVTNDGKVDVNDAAVLLNYVLDPSSVEITSEGFANAQIKTQKIEAFTAEHAAMILQKALNSTYKFPVE